ncbi:phosphoribosylglycinamide synthetase [Nemania sp. FL0916]|nr:phosphoribosylglycinamide synthetase [Nemania sp. FL0916]
MDRNSLRILLIGEGGREHALAVWLSKSHHVEKIICTPGNGGTARGCSKIQNASPSVRADDFEGLLQLARDEEINFVVPCSGEALVGGIVDYFRQDSEIDPLSEGYRIIFGPSKGAARLEGSKCFAKDFMTRHSIPTAKYWNCSTFEDAVHCLEQVDFPVVIKASGLTGPGEGVFMPDNAEESLATVKMLMCERAFGNAGDEIVIEELLDGDEISLTVITDGRSILSFPVMGETSERMGGYAPAPLVTSEQLYNIRDRIIHPSLYGIRHEGHMFIGFMTIGLMMTPTGPQLVDFNIRFGDPEAQTLLPMMDHRADLAAIMWACAQFKLDAAYLRFQPVSAASIVMTSKEYPDHYEVGKKIDLEPALCSTPVLLFQAGTILDGYTLKTNGRRVLTAVYTHPTLEGAIKGAYEGVENVQFEGKYFRTDIAKPAVPPRDYGADLSLEVTPLVAPSELSNLPLGWPQNWSPGTSRI